jgi:DNA-binding MarR family transcriptional regulator
VTTARPIPDLTARQAAVYAFIKSWEARVPRPTYGPTVPEISKVLGLSHAGAECHVRALVAKGLVIREPRIARSIRLA